MVLKVSLWRDEMIWSKFSTTSTPFALCSPNFASYIASANGVRCIWSRKSKRSYSLKRSCPGHTVFVSDFTYQWLSKLQEPGELFWLLPLTSKNCSKLVEVSRGGVRHDSYLHRWCLKLFTKSFWKSASKVARKSVEVGLLGAYHLVHCLCCPIDYLSFSLEWGTTKVCCL